MRTSFRCCVGAAEGGHRTWLTAGRALPGVMLAVALALTGCAGGSVHREGPPISTPPSPPGDQQGGAEHVVQRGETLAMIARRYSTDYQTLSRLNGLAPPYVIYPGQRLRIPGGGGSADVALPPGSWIWPTAGRTQRGFSDAHGGNKGLDIAGQIGQPIRAVAAGTVVYAGNGLRQYGNLVIVKHNPDYLSAYGHLQQIAVAEGSVVTQGQTIASMGSPGDGGGLLHFEIRLRGAPIDPARLLPPVR